MESTSHSPKWMPYEVKAASILYERRTEELQLEQLRVRLQKRCRKRKRALQSHRRRNFLSFLSGHKSFNSHRHVGPDSPVARRWRGRSSPSKLSCAGISAFSFNFNTAVTLAPYSGRHPRR